MHFELMRPSHPAGCPQGSRTRQHKSALIAAAGVLGLATVGALASLSLTAIGSLIDDAWAKMTETEASIERDIVELETKLADRRADLDAIRDQKQTLVDAQAEVDAGATAP